MTNSESPLSVEDRARIDAMPEPERAWEEEATRTFGPPEVRVTKNRRYTARLVRPYSEPAIRGMLKALSELDDPVCCENLRNHDLDSAPLHSIIRPFELLGLDFRVIDASDQRFTIEIGEGHGEVGSGSAFVLERTSDGTFRVVDQGVTWIADCPPPPDLS